MGYLYFEECDNRISDESLKYKKLDRCDLRKKKQNISPDCINKLSVLEWGAVTLFCGVPICLAVRGFPTSFVVLPVWSLKLMSLW